MVSSLANSVHPDYKSGQILLAALDTLSDAIAILDEHGTIVLVNRSWRQFGDKNELGKAKCAIGANYLKICDSASGERSEGARQVAEGIRNVIMGNLVEFRFDYSSHSSHEEIWSTMSAARFLNDGSIYTIVALKDIRNQSQRTLIVEEERTKVLQAFVANASHDLQTPVTAIVTSLHLLRQLCNLDEQQRHLSSIEKQIAHLSKLIKNLLLMAQLDAITELKRDIFDVNILLEELVSKSQQAVTKNDVAVNLLLNTSPLMVQGDTDFLAHAIENIFENAQSYTPPKGTLTIKSIYKNKNAIIEIRDSGAGIAATDLPYVFDRFYRADTARGSHTGGVGLGLSITKRVIELHSGKVEVESRLGEGTTFRISLPASTRNR